MGLASGTWQLRIQRQQRARGAADRLLGRTNIKERLARAVSLTGAEPSGEANGNRNSRWPRPVSPARMMYYFETDLQTVRASVTRSP